MTDGAVNHTRAAAGPTTGEAPDGRHASRPGSPALRKHLAGVLIAMLLVGLAAGWQSHRRATEMADLAAVENVRAVAMSLALPLSSEHIGSGHDWDEQLLGSTRPLIESGEILVAHIWRRIDATTGEILWSSDSRRRGSVVPLGGAAEALDTWAPVVEKLSDGTQSEGPPLPNLYEIYLPLHDRTGTPYVLEVYKPVREYDAIYRSLLADWLPIPIAGILLLSALTFPLSLRLAHTAAAAERDRALFADRALRARAEEHRRISEVLHERTVQDLSAARLILDGLKSAPTSPAIRTALDQTTELLAADVAELRDLLSSGEATEWQADALRDALTGWVATLPRPERILLDLPSEPLPLARSEVATALRIVKEGVRNAVKHAGETSVGVTVRVADERLTIEVADRGDGISPASTPGLGLRIVQYTAAAAGGEATVRSTPGGGTSLLAWLPYPHA